MLQPTPPLHLYPRPPLAPTDGVGPGVGQAFVRAYFPRVQHSLRIATAYFSLKGYRMAFSSLPPGGRARLKILVGKRDGYQVQRTVLEDLRQEMEHGVKLGSLHAAVFDLYQRMRAGELTICDARQMAKPFHCKIYLLDAASVFHGSANFSANGLKGQAEQLTYSTDQDLVADWTGWFEHVAAGALDLQAELRQLLADWLELASPFQVYLRALELLLSPTRELNHQAGAHTPVHYQRALASWAVRQLLTHRGAVLVVGVGLGKTVIGAEAVAQLWRADHLARIVVIAPPGVQSAWDEQLQGRGLRKDQHYAQFGSKALFQVRPAPGGQAAGLLEELQQAGPKTLLLIDEAHEYRNQQQATQARMPSKAKRRDQNSSGSLVFDRLAPALAAGAQVLLLTGSAYGTNLLNLTSLLRLLPPTAPPAPAAPESNPTLAFSLASVPPAPAGPQPWAAATPAAFGALPVVAVFMYPHALYLTRLNQPPPSTDADPDEAPAPPFLPFAHGPGYLPLGIYSAPIYYPPPCWEAILAVFDQGCFAQEDLITTEGYVDEIGPVIGKADAIGNQALAAWLSSPAALRAALAHNLATAGPDTGQTSISFAPAESRPQPITVQPYAEQLALWVEVTEHETASSPKTKRRAGASYGTSLRLAQAERQRQLNPIKDLLEAADLADLKLTALCYLINELCLVSEGQLIVFVRQRLTAAYLEQKLKGAFKKPGLKIACMVNKRGELKSSAERRRVREKFAPIAHKLKGPPYYRVLISTDADSLGVNLQDASNVANYDWPSSADGLIQRLGRVLRPAPYAGRIPRLYTFVPDCLRPPRTAAPASRTVQTIAHQYERLLRRHWASTQLLGFRVLGTDDNPHISLDIPVGDAALADKLTGETDGLSTAANSWTPHIETLETHRHLLSQLPSNALHSARLWPETYPRVVVLVQHRQKGVVPIVYDIQTGVLPNLHDLPVLNLLRADPQEEPAGVNLPRIMRYADLATRKWCEKYEVKPSSVKRLAALYLHPQHQAEDFDYLLKVEH